MVAAFLINKMNMTPFQACKFIIDKRPEAFHFGKSLNFENSLLKYHKSLQKCKSKSKSKKK
jgi:hypothetical protein